MRCTCGFRTFSSIEMVKHRSRCVLGDELEKQSQDNTSISLRRIHPATASIDVADHDADEISPTEDDSNERRKFVEEDFLVAKIMTQ